MSSDRAVREAPELFRTYAKQARAAAGGPVLVAIDYEIGGVHRLHRLGPQLSHPSAALEMTEAEIEAFGHTAGRAAKDLRGRSPRTRAPTRHFRREATSGPTPTTGGSATG